MRSVRYLVLLVTIAPVGCEWMRNGREQQQLVPRVAGPVQQRQPAELVAYVNQQANALQTLSYGDVKLSATEAGKDYPTLRDCTLAAAQPRNFRLVCGTMVTSQELDLGSNDREFWMYVKRLDGPNFFYCSHTDFAERAVTFPIPFDPDWVMMALGMTPYDAEGQYTVETDEKRGLYWLRQDTVTRQGQPITRSTIINADWDQGRRPVVRGLLIQDANKKDICTAEIKAVKTLPLGKDPNTGRVSFVQVPTQVTLQWPQQQFVMELDLRDERVNENLNDRMAALFNRPNIRGSEPIDLARYQFVTPTTSRSQAPADLRSRRFR